MQDYNRIHEPLARQAALRPDAPCFYEEGGGITTYGQRWRRVQAAARWLAAQCVLPGHLLRIVSENCPDVAVARRAAIRAGATRGGAMSEPATPAALG